MSRSYKKYPHWTIRDRSSKLFRRFHAKKVRKNWDIDNGSAYKRLVHIWDLEDYKHTEFKSYDIIPDEWYYHPRTGELEIEPKYSKKDWRQAIGK